MGTASIIVLLKRWRPQCPAALVGMAAAAAVTALFDLQTAGYDYNAPETLRRAAVKRIRTWWTTHRDRDW